MTHIDRYAPLFDTEEPVSWDEAKAIVLEAFGAFSAEMAAKAEEFFDENWIDAEARKGKRGRRVLRLQHAGHASGDPPELPEPDGRRDDPGARAWGTASMRPSRAGRATSTSTGTLPLAELASTFGEMLVFERLVADAKPEDKLALYADKVEGAFATIFRQAAMFRFERRAHLARRESGEITAEGFGAMWQEEIGAMFGDSLTLGEDHRMWWSYVGHFIGSPFYVYAYSFGELLALALFQKSKEEGSAFVDRYLDVLRRGGERDAAGADGSSGNRPRRPRVLAGRLPGGGGVGGGVRAPLGGAFGGVKGRFSDPSSRRTIRGMTAVMDGHIRFDERGVPYVGENPPEAHPSRDELPRGGRVRSGSPGGVRLASVIRSSRCARLLS